MADRTAFNLPEYGPPVEAQVEFLVASATGLPSPRQSWHSPNPMPPWYARLACEASASRAIHRDLQQQLASPRDRHHAIDYWAQNRAGDRPADLD